MDYKELVFEIVRRIDDERVLNAVYVLLEKFIQENCKMDYKKFIIKWLDDLSPEYLELVFRFVRGLRGGQDGL